MIYLFERVGPKNPMYGKYYFVTECYYYNKWVSKEENLEWAQKNSKLMELKLSDYMANYEIVDDGKFVKIYYNVDHQKAYEYVVKYGDMFVYGKDDKQTLEMFHSLENVLAQLETLYKQIRASQRCWSAFLLTIIRGLHLIRNGLVARLTYISKNKKPEVEYHEELV